MPGVPENFVSGWTPPGATRWQGRPVDVEVAPDGSLFITDDFNGFLYRVTYTGTAARVQP
jgi:glucose/arabinose dehydrogenase